MKKFFSFVCALVLVLSATAAPLKMDRASIEAMKANLPKVERPSFQTAQQLVSFGATPRRAVEGTPVSGIAAVQAMYYNQVWYMFAYDANNSSVAELAFYNGKEDAIAGTYGTATQDGSISYIVAAGDTVDLNGSFTIDYVQQGTQYPQYHIYGSNLTDSLSRSFDFDFTVEVPAYNYLYYMYCQYYGVYCDEAVITLNDAPVVPTGDTITLAIDNLNMNDQQIALGWWQISGYSADSTVYVTLSNVEDKTRTTAVGSYTYAEIDYTYSYLRANEENIHFADGTIAVSMNADGTYHVAATLTGNDGTVYVLTLNSFAMSANEITIAYANDTVLFTVTNNDPYFIAIETKAEYDSYESDFSQASLNDEVDSWIDYLAGYSAVEYYVLTGNNYVLMSEFFGDELATGDYVALVAPIYGTIRNGDASYLLFHYVKVVSEFMLTDNLNWGTAYVYAWDANGGEPYGAWPGTLVTETVVNDMQETQFVIGVPDVAVGIVVNNGSGAQTVDITDFNYEGYWMDGTQDGQGHYNVIGYGEHTTTIQNVEAAGKVVKALRNGQLIIRKNGVEFDVIGTRLK